MFPAFDPLAPRLPPWIGLFAATVISFATSVQAQHSDIAVFRNISNQLTTHAQAVAGQPESRVFERAFDFFGHPFGNPNLPKVFNGDDPGFQFTGTSAPVGYDPLPANSALRFNTLPFRLPNAGPSGNLFYWDGVGGSVSFGVIPANHTLTIVDSVNNTAVLNGAVQSYPDLLAGFTDSQSSMHQHPTYRLDDNDGNTVTDPRTGFYFFAMDLEMTGLQNSQPTFIAVSSPEIPASVEQQVVDWIASNLNQFTVLSGLTGDFDNNGVYACADVDSLVAAIAGGTNPQPFDITGDGQVNILDLDAWRTVAGAANLPSGNAYLRGDANLDGNVDGTDFGVWNANKFTSVAAWCKADFNANGAVDGSDFAIWNSHKFTSADGAFVPEPSVLSRSGVIFLASLWRRRASKKSGENACDSQSKRCAAEAGMSWMNFPKGLSLCYRLFR